MKGRGRASEKVRHLGIVSHCAKLMSQGFHDWRIKQALKEKYGMSSRSCQRYLSRARESLRKQYDLELERGKALQWYYDQINDPDQKPLVKLRVRERLDKILGLEAPLRHEVLGVDMDFEIFQRIVENPELKEDLLGLVTRARALESGGVRDVDHAEAGAGEALELPLPEAGGSRGGTNGAKKAHDHAPSGTREKHHG